VLSIDIGSDVTRINNPIGTTRIIMADLPLRQNDSGRASKSVASHEESAGSFGVVYVNEPARRALLNEKNPQFPVGSIIVREKLAHLKDAAPQLLAVMFKRERGFNPKANDWEFLILDGDARTVRQRERTGSCQKCHAQQKKSDFVFRTYLTEDVRLKQQ
jgi:hypothetical protein